jgi:putative transposase
MFKLHQRGDAFFFNTNSGTMITIELPEKVYQQVCFNYIHHNPVRAELVKTPEEWEFSSAREYAGIRSGTLVNMELARQYVET